MRSFSLCITCSGEMDYSSFCLHSASKRSFAGVLCTPEIYKVVEMGHMLEESYEVWDYPGRDDLFIPFVKKFLTNKQENSGFSPV